MPLLEAFPDENQIMKYKLVTLPRGTSKMPMISLGQSNIILSQTAEKSITPQTLNYLNSTSTSESSGYIFTVSDIRLFSTFKASGVKQLQAQSTELSTNRPTSLTSNRPTSLQQNHTPFVTNGTNISKSVTGSTLTLRATGVNSLFGSNNTLNATLTVVGKDSGARIQIPIQIKRTNSLTSLTP